MRAADRVLGWISTAVTSTWLLYVLCFGSDAGLSVPVLLVLVWGGAAALVVWALRFGVHLLAVRRAGVARSVRRLVVQPGALVVTFCLTWFGVTPWLRFMLSRPALDRFVQGERQSVAEGRFTPGTRVGLFHVREAELLPGGVVRLITTDCMFDHCGFVFSPLGEPPVLGEDTYSSLGQHWWHWWRSW